MLEEKKKSVSTVSGGTNFEASPSNALSESNLYKCVESDDEEDDLEASKTGITNSDVFGFSTVTPAVWIFMFLIAASKFGA